MIEFEQDDDVAAMLDEALRLLDHHLRDLDVARRRLVEGRGHHLALDRALHVRDFLRPLVDQENDQVALGVIGGDGVGDVLQQHRLAGARWRHDQRTLALADRRDDVDDPRRQILLGDVLVLHPQPLVGIERREVVEVDLVAGLFGVFEIDGAHLQKSEVALALLRAADFALDGIAGTQAEAADLGGRNINVVGAGEVVRLWRPQKAETVLEDLDDAFADDVDLVLGELFENCEHQLLLAHGRGILDVLLLGKNQQFGGGFGLQVLELHCPHAGNPMDDRRKMPIAEMEGKEPQVVGGARGLHLGPDTSGETQSGSSSKVSACVR